MEKKASNYLRLFKILFVGAVVFGGTVAQATSAFDLELNDAVQKKDWPSVVLLLQPKKGQNFEHDLTLAKAFLSLERRQEALKLLISLEETHKDERVNHLLQSAGTIFFNQDTSNLYYESLELIRTLKFPDARERLEQALAKEPDHILLLIRLIQVQLVLEKKSAAAANLKIAQSVTNGMPELKLFAAKLETDEQIAAHPFSQTSTPTEASDSASNDEDNELNLYQDLGPLKNQLLENEVTAPFWMEALKRAGKTVDLESLTQKILKDHPSWTYLLMWTLQNTSLNDVLKSKVNAQIEKNLKNKEAFLHALDLEMKKSDDLWVGYVSFDTINAQWAALHPKTPAH